MMFFLIGKRAIKLLFIPQVSSSLSSAEDVKMIRNRKLDKLEFGVVPEQSMRAKHERSGKRSGACRKPTSAERSGERAKSAAQNPLQRIIMHSK